jgi:hypothetical protein
LLQEYSIYQVSNQTVKKNFQHFVNCNVKFFEV